MNRPVGVTILAILEFIGAVILVLLGIGSIVGMGLLCAAMSQSGGGSAGAGGIMAVIGGALSVFCFIFAAICALLGWGLWKLKNWARIIVIVLAVLGAVFALLGLLQFSAAVAVGIVIRLAINGLIVWYLLRPDVAAAFKGPQGAAASA